MTLTGNKNHYKVKFLKGYGHSISVKNSKITHAHHRDWGGGWTITYSCILNSNHSLLNGSVIVQNNSMLTIPSGVTLDIDFANHNLTVKFGSGVLIKSGEMIT